jgi:cytochrome c oxidase subunit 4
MSENHTHTTDAHEHGDHAGLSKKKIWEVFFILLGITVIEFIIALWVIPAGHMSQSVGNYVYIILTLLKAYYIIAYFMHLKFEKYGLIVSMGVSLIFIVYFIVLMLIEGNYLFDHTPNF